MKNLINKTFGYIFLIVTVLFMFIIMPIALIFGAIDHLVGD